MGFSFHRSDFRSFKDTATYRGLRRRLQELGDMLREEMRSSATLRDFAKGDMYVPTPKTQGTNQLKSSCWVGFAHKHFEDAHTAVAFQYGIDRSGIAFWGIWIQGDAPTRRTRKEVYESLQRFDTSDLCHYFKSLGKDVELYYHADDDKVPALYWEGPLSKITEDQIEDLLLGLKKPRRFYVGLTKYPLKGELLRMKRIEKNIMLTTKELLPVYELLSGLGTPSELAGRTIARNDSSSRIDEKIGETEPDATNKIPRSAETEALIKRRIGQEAVRKTARENYPDGCAMCRPRINEPGLLVASHIKKWSRSSRREKFDCANVLRLCALHDELFERGYIMVDKRLRIRYSNRLEDGATLRFITHSGRSTLSRSKNCPPSQEYLRWHREYHDDMKPFKSLAGA